MYSKSKNEGKLSIGFLIILTIIFLISLGPYLSIPKISTYILVPLLFAISFITDFPFEKNNKIEFKLILAILVLSLISVFYCYDYNVLTRGFSSLFGAVLASFIPLAINKKRIYFGFFHLGYVLAILVLIIIMYLNDNFSFTDFATKIDYRDRFLLNANQYSYLGYFANISLFYYHAKSKNIFSTIALIVLPILFLIICFATQSRAGLIIIIAINLAYWFFINSFNKKNKIIVIGRSLIVILFFSIISVNFYSTYQNSRLKSRVVSAGNKTDSRIYLIYDSIEAFKKNPILGVGLGQIVFYTRYGLFSHNSYVEIIAEQGLIGGLLLILLFLIPLVRCIKGLYRNPRDSILKINLLFFLTFYFYNNFYVFYKFPFSMMYFFLVISIQYEALNLMIKQESNLNS